jgi:hypothetical protein
MASRTRRTPKQVPLEELAATAAAEGLELTDETGDAEALRYDPNRLGAPEPYVVRKWPHAARGKLANQLLESASLLGYPVETIRSTSDGFKYPEAVDRYLFPSEYAE